MNKQILKQELKLNAEALIKCNNTQERLELLIQRSNLKDMLIEILEAETNKEAA